jgi:hypothetical protein
MTLHKFEKKFTMQKTNFPDSRPSKIYDVHIRMYVSYVCMNIRMYVCMHVCIYIRMYVCMPNLAGVYQRRQTQGRTAPRALAPGLALRPKSQAQRQGRAVSLRGRWTPSSPVVHSRMSGEGGGREEGRNASRQEGVFERKACLKKGVRGVGKR